MYRYKTKGEKTARMRVPRKTLARFGEKYNRMLAEALERSITK